MGGLDHRMIEASSLSPEAFPEVRQELRVFIAEEAFDRAVERGSADLGREVGGILVGRVLRDASGPYVRVDTTIDALHADEKSTEVTFTHTTWDHINKEMDSRHAGKKIIGWYHTHPGFGIFLSDRDQFIHRSFFNLPFQVAFVYDPKKREHGLFVWRDGEPWRCRRYWIGLHEEQWDGPRAPSGPPVKSDWEGEEVKEARMEGSRSPEGGYDLYSLGLAGLVILVLGGMAGWWWGSRSGRENPETAPNQVAEFQSSMKNLNVEILSLVRRTLDSETTGRTLDECVAGLEGGEGLLAGAGNDPAKAAEALRKVRTAAEQLRGLRDSRGKAEQYLRLLEEAARRGSVDTSKVVREMQVHRGAIGNLYSVMALERARAGDRSSARQFLLAAVNIDPENHGLYEKALQTFEEGGKLPLLAPPPAEARKTPAEPPPAPAEKKG